MTKKDIGRMIRELRKAMGLTQEQFAAEVGVTWSTVSRWENNRGSPSPLARHRIKELQARSERLRDHPRTGEKEP